jgi:hypothetical protein
MVFIFLTPQPNDFSTMVGDFVCKDLISTLKSINNGETVATYQTCLESLRIATSLANGSIQVILSNGEMKEVAEADTLESILELEKLAIAEAFNTPCEELKAKTDVNEIKINAMDFYQAAYYDENKDKIENQLIENIKQEKGKNATTVSNELDVINKIIEAYNIKGHIVEINCNDNIIDSHPTFFQYLKRIIMPEFVVPQGSVDFADTKELNYVFTFDSGAKICRKGLEFSVVEN